MPYATGDVMIMGAGPNEEYRNSGFYEEKFKKALRLSGNDKITAIKAVLEIPITQKTSDVTMKVRKMAARFFPKFEGESEDTTTRKEHCKKLVRLFEDNNSFEEINKEINLFLNKEGLVGRYAACLLGLKNAMTTVAKQHGIKESDREMCAPKAS